MEFLLIYLLIFIPVVSAFLTFILPGRLPRILTTTLFSISMLAIVFLLGRFIILWGEINIYGERISIAAEWVIKLINLGLCIVFFIIGVNVKKFSIAIIALIQLSLLTLLETDIFGRMKTGGLVFTLNFKMVVLISIVILFGIFIAFAFSRSNGKLLRAEKKSLAYGIRFPLIFLMISSVCGIILSDNLIWMLCFWEILTICIYIITNIDNSNNMKEYAIKVLRINLLGGTIFISATILIFMCIGNVSISNIVAESVNQPLTIAIGLMCLAIFIRSGLFPYIYHDIKSSDVQYKLINISSIVIPNFAAIYLLLRISVFLDQPIQSRTVAAAGAILFLGYSFMSLISGYISRSGYYCVMSNLSIILCIISLRKDFFEWTVFILLGYSIFLSLLLYVFQKYRNKKRKNQLLNSFSMILYISICVFINVFIAKIFALSPFYYTFVIPACALNTIYIINSIAFLLNNNLNKAEENRESLSRYINFEIFSRIDERKCSIILNVAEFAVFAIMIGVIL